MIKKILLLSFLVIVTFYILVSLYFLDKDYFLCPIDYNCGMVIRSDTRGDGFFAARRNGRRTHEGIDLLAEIGTPVKASRSGKVIVSRVILNKQKKTGSGNYIIISHPGNITTAYAHLSEVYVKKGDFIRQGEVIGSVGKTGNANFSDIQPHLHFEVRRGGVAQNPEEYLE